MSMTQTIVADIVTPKERGRYQGYIGAVFASSSIGGPVLGGVLTEHLHWSLIFWINLPLGLIALALTSSVLRRLPLTQRKHALDLPGRSIDGVGRGRADAGADLGRRAVPVAELAGARIVCGFGAVMGRFRLAARDRAGGRSCRCRCWPIRSCAPRRWRAPCCMGVLVGLTIFIPLYFETVIHLSASQSGLALIPLMGASVISATLTGPFDGADGALQTDGVWGLRGRDPRARRSGGSGRSDCRWLA